MAAKIDMKAKSENGVTKVLNQEQVVIPDLSVKDLLSAIPLVAILVYSFRVCFLILLE